MSKMTGWMKLVLVAIFSVMVAGAALPGCDHGTPPSESD